MTELRIGSLFSGAGGLDMAVEAVFGGETVWHSEINRPASKVLAYHWPHIPNLGDITAVNWSDVPAIDILCGGFPCQDVSAAGRRAGLATNTRSGLWAVMATAIAALRPQIVVIENVRGLLSAQAHRTMESAEPTVGDRPDRPVLRAIGAVVGDLADLGYVGGYATVSAGSVGAPHRRDRVFILSWLPGTFPLCTDLEQLVGAYSGGTTAAGTHSTQKVCRSQPAPKSVAHHWKRRLPATSSSSTADAARR